MSALITTQATKLGQFFGMDGDGTELVQILKATAFKGQVSDAQMAALMVVANQYKLNPFTRELYAFPDKNNGIVPVVGVDGWARIINNHPQFDGMDFEQDDESCTCIIHRKDRGHPVKVTEFMSECKRGNMGPWQSHPKRMLRHKAMIQAARLAFGYGGIYDPDEAERITEGAINPETGEITRKEPPPARPTLPAYSDDDMRKNIDSWRSVIESGRKTPDEIIAMVSTKGVLSEQQKTAIRNLAPIEAETDQFVKDME